MIKAICQKCSGQFYREEGEEWKKLCLDCWKKKSGINKPANPARDNEIAMLRQRAHYLETRMLELEEDLAQETWLRTIAEEQLSTNSLFMRKLNELNEIGLNRVISLVHPDRHGNSPLSNTVTRIFLDMKKCWIEVVKEEF